MQIQLKVVTSCLMLFLLGAIQANAQQSTHTAGGDASGSTGSVAYSVGQTVYHTQNNASNSIAAGVQQPYEISVVTENKHESVLYMNVQVFPNPSSQSIQLNVGEIKLNNISYQLTDMEGKLLENKMISTSVTEIDIQAYASSCFFVQVLSEGQHIKTFKIIKK